MGLFSFVKDLGKKIEDLKQEQKQEADTAGVLAQTIYNMNLGIENLNVQVDGSKVTLSGNAPTQEAREKAILAVGNIHGIGQVEDFITVTQAAPESTFYEVQSGDSLSKIAKHFYGDANKYHAIFEANKPMLSDPDKIYPGQSLRIPAV